MLGWLCSILVTLQKFSLRKSLYFDGHFLFIIVFAIVADISSLVALLSYFLCNAICLF